MNNVNEIELSESQRLACNVAAGGILVACGFFLMLCGLGVIPLKISDVVLPSVLMSLGIVFITSAGVQKNTVALWLSFFFTIPAVIVILVVFSNRLTYSKMYPFFIAIPGIASFFTFFFTKERKLHAYSAAFFMALTALFCIESFSVASWNAVIPSIIIFIGFVVILSAVWSRKNIE